jgi:hypothetical protein
MSGTTDYLVTIGGQYQKDGGRSIGQIVSSEVVEIPNAWTEFEIQEDALNRLLFDPEQPVSEDERQTFVINLYRAEPNSRKPRAPNMAWLKGIKIKALNPSGHQSMISISCSECQVRQLTDEEDLHTVFTLFALKHRTHDKAEQKNDG